MPRNDAYGYAVARIRALEAGLFDAPRLQRMIDADGLDAALKILAESDYARWMTEGARYDSALEAELRATFDEFAAFVPDRELIDVFRIPYDFHNVKVLLKGAFKARAGGKKRYDLLTRLGSVPADDLVSRVESEEYGLLPWGLSVLLPSCASMWEQSADIVEIERVLDGGMFDAIVSLASSLGFPGVISWARARIDSENIRNLLRMKRFGFDSSTAASFLHGGGTVAVSALLPLMSDQFDAWGRSLAYSDVGMAISATEGSGDFDELMPALERALDDFCSAAVANARYSASAPENVTAFLWGKEMEIKNIRTILVSKAVHAAKTDREGVKGMMRRGYFG
ncbi:MAG: V-type ATPase subunit [Synergistaceae bacterium]|jgi:V/A-type H+-transporting ATPase subunit C|nr:V-type ATPase subunit [Synergistaceae bacterium]